VKSASRSELRAALVSRRSDDHKGVFGHVLIAAGSRGMAGAAILCAKGALRSGAGLVTLAVPASLQASVAGHIPEAMTLGLPENSAGCLRPDGVGRLKQAHKDRQYSVLAIGPGLTEHPDTARFVLLALSSLPIPAVVDADALNILASEDEPGVRELMGSRKEPCVLTPHPGEAARCLQTSTKAVMADREAAAQRLARDWNAAVLLKGHRTLICDGERTVANATGGSGLAKGGTGDVLTGLIAGLWAQMLASSRIEGKTGFLAAALGAHLHGLAGDAAEKKLTPQAMTAQDVVASLPEAFAGL
jgi:ADP-dependent NAD(P)H-hydrate dehydratase / NAD(P)H-hydrate epimerase